MAERLKHEAPLTPHSGDLSGKVALNGGDGGQTAISTMFRQWRTLADRAEQLSVLLWISDGSELLDWSGDFTDTFEWACWSGCANHLPQPENPTPRQLRDTHLFPQKVFPESVCAPLPYSWLRDTVAAIRAVARAEMGREIRIGAILDAGPEFAISDFKMRRHPEAMQGRGLHKKFFLSCSCSLHAEARRYAAFPNGIPEGLSFGTFVGSQFREYSRDFGFDYLWLSNGLGFGDEPWGVVGSLFDGERFLPEHVSDTSGRMLGFWGDFFAACPGAIIETRGSNYSAGVEIASDAAPLGPLYADGLIEPPVNSPWAALVFDTGLELAAWMSHVAELPKGRGFPFRYYIHDPWFRNSPWLDRYAREPWDIYAPLSICRIREDGSVQTPDSLAFLSVDDTLGRMPEKVPLDVTPLLLDAFETAPDYPGPLVWVYPFEEYSGAVDTTLHPDSRAPSRIDKDLPRIFNEDLFLGEALQGGLPLNTVCSTRVWRELAARGTPMIFVLPVSALLSPGNLAALDAWEARGARFLLYGPLDSAPASLLGRLGLALAEPLVGDAIVETSANLQGDEFTSGAPCNRLFINPALDSGGLAEVPLKREARLAPRSGDLSGEAALDGEHGDDVSLLAIAAFPNGACRVIAARRGAYAYVRSALPLAKGDVARPGYFSHAPATGAYPVERLMRHVLGEAFGWSIRAVLPSAATLPPRLNISRHCNAFFLHVFAPDTTAALRVRAPFGAPLLTEHETPVDNGEAIWRPAKSWRHECRLFAEGLSDGIISVKTSFAAYPGYEGRLQVRGLENATIRFFPPDGFDETVELVRHEWNFLGEDVVEAEWEDTPQGRCAVWRNISGPIFIAW